MDLEYEAGASVRAAAGGSSRCKNEEMPHREDVELTESLIREPTSIFGFRSMLVQQPEFLLRINAMVDDKFNIRAEPAGSRPRPFRPSSSNHAYDPLRYTGVRPYPDSRGPPEFDPTPDTSGRDQCQLYATAYYYDAKSMLKQACRMKIGSRETLPESVLTALKGCSDPEKPSKPTEADGSTDGFRKFDDEHEFERMVTRRLFPLVSQRDWQITKGFRKKLFELNNAFYEMRQKGIILAVDCGPEGAGGGDSGGGGGSFGGGGEAVCKSRRRNRGAEVDEELFSLEERGRQREIALALQPGAGAAAAVLLTEEEKAQTSRELDEDFRRIEQGGAY